MPHLHITKRARTELSRIWDYIAERNEDAADRFIRELLRVSQQLAEAPGMGPYRPEFGRSLRSFPVGDYLVFYREVSDGIDIVHFVHGARDLLRFFRRPESN